jgi:transposase
VVDRFHLLRNLGEAIEPVLARHQACLQDEGNADEAPAPPRRPAAPPSPVATPAPAVLPPRPTTSQQARHAAVHELVERGLSLSDIARALDLDRKTVRRYAHAATATAAASPRRPRRSRLDPFKAHLQQRWQEGCHNATRLYHELCARGYRGSRTTVRAYLAPWRTAGAAPPRQRVITVRQVMRLLLRRPTELTAEEQALLDRITGRNEELTSLARLVRAFTALLRERRGDELRQWVDAVVTSGIAELVAFARGLEQDWSAVVAGLTLEWSSGQVEGQVNRVKLIKRQMFGRAKPALLRKRVLLAG